MFDVSHMGEFLVEGPDALALIQWISSNDAAKLVDGKVQYACLPNGRGGIVDDMLVYRHAADRYMLVVNASNRAKNAKRRNICSFIFTVFLASFSFVSIRVKSRTTISRWADNTCTNFP